MDNATFHTRSHARKLMESYGATLLWLPKYSPDLNRIEPQWANLKHGIRANNDSNLDFFQKLERPILEMAE